MRATRTTLAAAAAAAVLALAACGDDDDKDTAAAEHGTSTAAHAGTTAGSGGHGTTTASGGHGTSTEPAHGGGHQADGASAMTELASAERAEMAIAVMASEPETFYVSEGDRLRRQAPGGHDDAHLMVTLADAESGVRLPDATVTARIADAHGRVAFEGPLYPMIGRGMGMHYGENVELTGPGTYEVTLTVGSPRIGRHRAVAKAWGGPQRVTFRVSFDGKALSPAS
jgi:hypothetical protein